MKANWRGLVLPAVAAVVICSIALPVEADNSWDPDDPDRLAVQVAGSWTGYGLCQDISLHFKRQNSRARAVISPMPTEGGIMRLCDGRAHIAICHGDLTNMDRLRLKEAFPAGTPQPKEFVIGQYVTYIITRNDNPVRQLSFEQIHKMLDRKPVTWKEVGGADVPVAVHSSGANTLSYEMIRHKCMGSWYFRKDIAKHKYPAIIDAVAKGERGAFGFFLYRRLPVEGVQILSLGKNAEGPFFLPSEANIYEEKYPLMEKLVLLLHPDAPPEALEYCELVVSSAAAPLLKSYYLFPESERYKYFADKRFAEAKQGKRRSITHMTGVMQGKDGLLALAEEFVRAKAVVQVGYTPMATDVAGMGAFLATTGAGEAMRPRQELLLLDDRPSERAMQAHGERWNALGKLRAAASRAAVDDDTIPRAIDGAGGNARPYPSGESAGVAVAEAVGYDDGPVEYLIAARGVAVIVNPSNKLNSLTLDQLRSVFSGELQDWSILAGGGGGAGKQEIKLFGLPQADVVTHIFANECLATDKWRRVTIRKSSDEVIKAVASDPAAIGIVDLATVGPVALAGLQSETAASAAGRSVKLLSIDLGRAAGGGAGGAGGLRGAAAMPPLPAIPATADNLKNAMYPLSQRLYLYVHPLASDTAKDFAKFVATCGASEATPYADTVKSMIETYQKNGLIPLADEAINRMAKDALAAATKED